MMGEVIGAGMRLCAVSICSMGVLSDRSADSLEVYVDG